MSERGRLVVVSGPSGSGKTTICDRLLELGGLERIVTCTTRAPRAGERDGIDYRFLDRATFEEGVRSGRFLEHAEVHGRCYGTPRDAVESGVAAGKTLLLNIDVQGARQVREADLQGVTILFIFIAPPDLATLEERLANRGTDSDEEVRRRLEVARAELREREHYDHVIVNDDLESAVARARRLIGVEARTT